MDGSTVEHSDSDSGESWTLLENTPTYDLDAPDLPESATIPSDRLNSDKDEDTDGISIISDSENESTSCEINYISSPPQEPLPTEQQNLSSSPPTNTNHNKEPVRDEIDFLGDNIKFKTYVHRRNPRVGTILDILMLGMFVITAGMALGHLWSCKNECTPQTSVNKILSNLYKLQEENAYLKNKLKEISLATGYQLVQRKSDKPVTKLQKCKKIFEEPVMKNNRAEPGVKCVTDNKPVLARGPTATLEQEKEFLKDIDKMKKIYDQTKNLLDGDTKKQFDELFEIKTKKQFDEFIKANAFGFFGLISKVNNEPLEPINMVKPDVIVDSDTNPSKTEKSHRQINLEEQLGPTYLNIPPKREPNTKYDMNMNSKINSGQLGSNPYLNVAYAEEFQNDISPQKKITYADSLKIEQPLRSGERAIKNAKPSARIKDNAGKRKHKYENDLLNVNSVSEEDIKKDDRYTGPKTKHEKKKQDRQKSHKKQKRINKYEQWEMKGGYMKDFDELSLASSQDNDKNLLSNPDRKFKNPNFENYVIKFIDAEINDNNASNRDPNIDNKSSEKASKVEKRALKGDKPRKKSKDSEWYDQRSALRAEARLKLEHELFGENVSNNGAAWYFRRMQKREQCRAQKDNSTFKKFSKRKMNFKMKR